MVTKIIAFYTAFVIALGTFGCIGEPKIPKASSEQELLSMESIIEKKQLPREIYALSVGSFTQAEKNTAIALQGIVAKTSPCIYYMMNGVDGEYLSEMEKAGITVHRVNWNLDTLLEKFGSYIGEGGYILYRASEWGEGLNVAVNYATAFGWLPVEQSTEELAKKHGLICKMDISEDTYDYAFEQKHWEVLREHFKTGAVIHEKYGMQGLRDLAVSQGFYCFYTNSTDEGNRYLKKVLKWSGKNTYILGWVEQEKHFVALASELGCTVTPADICWNNSLLCSFETDVSAPHYDTPVASTDPAKHYVTLVFSDGDNCQWIQNGFSEYRQTVSNYPDATVTWTLSPFLCTFSPVTLKRVYATANKNQYFIAGPSGIGYCNLTCYDTKSLDLMSARTASAMLRSNQRILTVLDDYTLLKDKKLAYRLGYFSRFNNIDGGILFLDPHKYQEGKGKVWFSNGKPFAGVRLSLWADGGYEGATDEWIKSRADIINNYPADIHSVNGYSVVCIHAWSVKPAALQKFIAALDDDVVILQADDFLKTMQENLPHKNAAPEEFYQ